MFRHHRQSRQQGHRLHLDDVGADARHGAARIVAVADAGAFANRFNLPPDQREALIKLDLPAIVKMGAHPLVPFLANMQIQRLRPQR